MKMKCPQCEYDGEFKKARVPFFYLFSIIGTYRAAKTLVCPKCRTEIKRSDAVVNVPTSSAVVWILVTLLVLVTLIFMSSFMSSYE